MQRRPLHTDRLKSAGYDARHRRLEIHNSNGNDQLYKTLHYEIARRFFA